MARFTCNADSWVPSILRSMKTSSCESIDPPSSTSMSWRNCARMPTGSTWLSYEIVRKFVSDGVFARGCKRDSGNRCEPDRLLEAQLRIEPSASVHHGCDQLRVGCR